MSSRTRAPNSEVDIDLKVLDREGNAVRATKFFHSGDHPTLRLRTREGFEVTGTHNHPVLCVEQVAGVPMLQWKLLEEIEPGTRVIVSRHVERRPRRADPATSSTPRSSPAPGSRKGSTSSGRAGFNNTDRMFFDAVVDAYDGVVGGTRYVRADRCRRAGRCTSSTSRTSAGGRPARSPS